jgi:hypothetical protein
MEEIVIKNSEADQIIVRRSIVAGGIGGVAIKAIGYPSYSTAHLTYDQAEELITALRHFIDTKI